MVWQIIRPGILLISRIFPCPFRTRKIIYIRNSENTRPYYWSNHSIRYIYIYIIIYNVIWLALCARWWLVQSKDIHMKCTSDLYIWYSKLFLSRARLALVLTTFLSPTGDLAWHFMFSQTLCHLVDMPFLQRFTQC